MINFHDQGTLSPRGDKYEAETQDLNLPNPADCCQICGVQMPDDSLICAAHQLEPATFTAIERVPKRLAMAHSTVVKDLHDTAILLGERCAEEDKLWAAVHEVQAQVRLCVETMDRLVGLIEKKRKLGNDGGAGGVESNRDRSVDGVVVLGPDQKALADGLSPAPVPAGGDAP